MYCSGILLFSMVICELQTHFTLSDSTITIYDENISLLAHLRLGHQVIG